MRRYVRIVAVEAFADARGHRVQAGGSCVLDKLTGQLHCARCAAKRSREELLAAAERVRRGRYGR